MHECTVLEDGKGSYRYRLTKAETKTIKTAYGGIDTIFARDFMTLADHVESPIFTKVARWHTWTATPSPTTCEPATANRS
ncbi:hypothetical protein SAMN05444004_1206 [Jannaschia faecimaris]|uniref:Uncharacterized protein n=1 Tax=Jannaschia faecimaris TaxID=1244108 RepID=A0A1H3TUZ1_9RHOB|nr:hypothetical protein [Jannaschia faecimaris]SDZ54054.1 hypothetical protein SAMN05444004_1206 [Jannaschia faecimaris]